MANILLELIKRPLQTSLVVPESKALTHEIVQMADLSRAKATLEKHLKEQGLESRDALSLHSGNSWRTTAID